MILQLNLPVKNMEGSEKVTLNVGGKLFTTTRGTLSRLPHTVLSQLHENDASYDKTTGHYFFDHNPELFNWILDAHR